MKILNMVISLECCKPHKAACYLKKCDINNEVKLFLIVYRRIYCGNVLMLSNQTSHYKIKCIRIQDILSQISDTIQCDVVLQKQVHSNSSYLGYSKLDFFMFFTLIFGDNFFLIDFSKLCSR